MEQNLKRLDRKDLLELLIQQNKKIEQLEKELAEARTQLEDRKVSLAESGSLAEASLRLSGIFEAAQRACDLYTENVRVRNEGLEARCTAQEQETEERCRKMVADAEAQSEAYWQQASQRVQALLDQSAGLRELLTGGGKPL